LACGRLAKRAHRGRCNSCYRRQLNTLAVGTCRRCERARRVWPDDGLCARCAEVIARNSPPAVRACATCGRTARIATGEICRPCWSRQPGRPYDYAVGLRRRLVEVPAWFDDFVAYTAARLSPSRAVDALHAFGTHLNAVGSANPRHLVVDPPPRVRRLLVSFLTARRLVLIEDDDTTRARQRRRRRIDDVPDRFRPAVADFADALTRRHDRAIRLGLRTDTHSTVEARLATLRDLARFCVTDRPAITGWETIAISDVEAFLARRSTPSAGELADLRSFFRWARRQRVVLTNPTDGVRIRQFMTFTGETLDHREQRRLYQRWTSDPTVHPHETFFGLVALIHAASTAEIRELLQQDVDISARTVRLGRRPAIVLDPDTWEALQRCIDLRRRQRGENPHIIVSRVSASRDTPVAPSYFARLLASAATTPNRLRTTRLSAVANQLDPVIVAAVFGVTHKSAAYYRNDDVIDDLAQPTTPIGP
jgi:site-specific recombinase XerD